MLRKTTGLRGAFSVLSRGFVVGRVRGTTTLIAPCLACAWLAASASGASFGVNLIDAGGVVGGSLGNPITWSPINGAFNPAIGSDRPPSQFASDQLRYDSYVAIDPYGPSFQINPVTGEDGYSALGPTNIIPPTATPNTVFGPGSLSGIWFSAGANGGFVASDGGDTGLNRMFIAQITLRSGTSNPTTAGLHVNIRDFGTINPDGELGALRFGSANASNNAGKWGQAYYLDWQARVTTGVNATFNGGTTYAIYVVAVPGPSAGALLAFAGATASRRARPSAPLRD